MKRKFILASVMLIAFAITACGSTKPTASTLVPQLPTVIGTAVMPITGLGTETPTAPSVVSVSQNNSLGPILVDEKGMTLYMYTMDNPNSSSCYNSCASIWLPFLTDGTPTAGSGVQAKLLGTTMRTDGSMQVSYNGHPLYYFAKDTVPGDTTGENVQNVWFVVTPAGDQR